MIDKSYLEDSIDQFKKYKSLADKALAQISDDKWLDILDENSNSIAIVVKHMAGNMLSRWRDFLTSDGEKPDRHRDTEFEFDGNDSVALLRQRWESGWQMMFDALDGLSENDLEHTVLIRGEVHTVMQAINRQLTHYAYHVGQIVFLARHYAGNSWQSLSIPKGKSEEFNRAKF